MVSAILYESQYDVTLVGVQERLPSTAHLHPGHYVARPRRITGVWT